MRHISQGILTDQVQFGTVGYGEGSSGLAYSHSGAHKMPSFSVSISLPCNFHFFPGYTYLHKHTHKQHTTRRSPCLATQKHSTFHVPTSPRFGFAREPCTSASPFWSTLICMALSTSWPVFTSTCPGNLGILMHVTRKLFLSFCSK